jgi:hypothetical protein
MLLAKIIVPALQNYLGEMGVRDATEFASHASGYKKTGFDTKLK